MGSSEGQVVSWTSQLFDNDILTNRRACFLGHVSCVVKALAFMSFLETSSQTSCSCCCRHVIPFCLFASTLYSLLVRSALLFFGASSFARPYQALCTQIFLSAFFKHVSFPYTSHVIPLIHALICVSLFLLPLRRECLHLGSACI